MECLWSVGSPAIGSDADLSWTLKAPGHGREVALSACPDVAPERHGSPWEATHRSTPWALVCMRYHELLAIHHSHHGGSGEGWTVGAYLHRLSVVLL